MTRTSLLVILIRSIVSEVFCFEWAEVLATERIFVKTYSMKESATVAAKATRLQVCRRDREAMITTELIT